MENNSETNPKSSSNILIIVTAVVVVAAAVLFLVNRNKDNTGSQAVQTQTVSTLSVTPTISNPSPTATEAGTIAVSIKSFKFTPETITINKGESITWTNEDTATHTVTASDKSFDSGKMPNGKTFSHTFDNVGSFDYVCSLHPSMKGKVVVK